MRIRGQHRSAIAKHGHVVGHGKRFGQFVSDQNDGATSISKGPEPFEQIPALRGRENGSGLVHDQHLRATSESFQDLESLLSCHDSRWMQGAI